MPKLILKKASWVLLATVCIAAVIVNSCKKDSHSEQQNKVSDPAMAQAKSWYESTYPTSNIKLNTQAITTTTDLSQLVKPDWGHAASYSRFNKQVIEMPVDPGSKFETALLIGKVKSNKTYSRNYFLLLNDGQKYEAYVMMITADSSYVNNDLSKLSHNTYRKHDADFSGSVLYFTPRGEYVDGYAYKNGQLITASANQQTDKPKVQSVQTNGKKIIAELNCIAWYLDSYQNGVLVSEVYLYTTCSGNGESGGGGNSSGGGNKPPPPKPHCTPDGTTDPPSDPGGFPEPDPGSCPVLVQTTITNDVLGCNGVVINSLTDKNLSGNIRNILQNVFNSSDNVNLHFVESTDTEGHAASTTTTRSSSSFNMEIKINPNILPNDASQDYKASIIIHEIIHGYLNYKGIDADLQLQQHSDIAHNYIGDIASMLQQAYGTDPENAKALAFGGLGDFATKYPSDYNQLLQDNGLTEGQRNSDTEFQREGLFGKKCN
ncbi:hypothetical protein G7092_21495 [Mucilaginibacter sp. HC2]|uniref:hypothetical protein n=1 Tax=Mucilaginibacter inviolabilis TaxID=2714892 RepID=UPI00140D1EDC|nr:hypothetical protein [Mucilaginibacter inviolabilis]NHA06399.1 hypothetical protein [Mucilaginibacter inviolabilis]